MALSKIVENSIADEAVSSAKLKDFSAAVDLNGVELVLDADADTSITADTDDRIDIKIANTDHISFGTSSGDTVIKAMVDAKDILFQQFDGRTLLDINDGGFVGIANGATGPGELRIFEDTDNGSNYVGLSAGSISSSFTLTLPTADGSSGQFLKTDGSGALSFDTVSSAADDLTAGDAAVNLTTTSGNITIDAQGNDTDIIFKGTDGGSDKVFMTIDGSAGGDLFLTGGLIDLKNDGSAVSQIKFYCESSNAHAQTLIGAPHSESASNTLTLPSSGGDAKLVSVSSTATLTNKTLTTPIIAEIDSGSSITLDATTDIILDADGADIIFKDGGTSILTITNNSTDVDFTVATQDKDINFKGDDGGSGITALSLDMSDAGTAVFNHDIRIADGGQIGSASDADAIAIAANGVTTFSQNPVFPAGGVDVASLDIDGATDIGAAIVDADLFIIDDGAGGTNRKVAASRIKTYAGFSVSDITGATELAATPADTDEFIISDAGTLKRIDFSYIKASNGPAFDVREASLQDISHNTYTNLTFATEITDTANAFSSNTFTVPSGEGGTYFLGLQVQGYQASTRLTAVDATIWKGNNNTALSRAYNKSNAVTHIMTNVACIVALSAGDVIGGAVTMTTTNSGDAQSYGGDQGTRIFGFKLAGL